tara:strand:+ start:2682 stop:3356 length:675 start_codon:yes stop_codon:yes gene_type:complete
MSEENKGLVTVTDKDLSLVDNNMLNASQLNFLMKPTPKKYIRKRKAKGAGDWDYVSGAYVKKVLNLMFGWDWDFKIVDYKFDLQIKQAFVQGELTCRTAGKTIVKHQFGRVDIKFRTSWENGKKTVTDQPLDLGNDLKAATTDALKKCASELGIAADIYSPQEFNSLKVVEKQEVDIPLLRKLLDNIAECHLEDVLNIERIIELEETSSYDKAYKFLVNNQATR